MTTQLCFDPGAIATWLAARRAEGIALPVHVGIPGVAEPHKLLAISARIGVADTHRFLTKNIRFVARLMRSGGFYRPDGLLEGLAPHIADPAARIVDLHLYTFNAVEATEKWRRVDAGPPGRLTRRPARGACSVGPPAAPSRGQPNSALIQSGGGTGPLKPRQPTGDAPARCQFRAGLPAR